MNRSIGMERVYFLGDYKSLRVTDYANDIPEELALNEEFMTNLRSLQLEAAERAYYSYSLLSKELKDETEIDFERLNILIELETDTYKKLIELYNSTKEEK